MSPAIPVTTTARSASGNATPASSFPARTSINPAPSARGSSTPEEVGDITKAHLITRLNGTEQQHATIDDLCFDIPTLIEYCSTFTQLEPGDVIATGTTGGVGAYQTPPLWMKPGDTIEVEITGIGTLRNPVIAED